MKILLYAINYSPELTGIGKYSGEMARWWAARGHEVRVVTAPPYYPDWKVWPGYAAHGYRRSREEGVTVTRCPLYVPSRPSALKRILHLASFSLSSLPVVLAQLRWKPDLVILLVPTLFCAPQALLTAKLCKARAVIHIHDYEVDAMFGLGMAKGKGLKRIAYWLEKTIFKAFDKVSAVSINMLQRAEQKGVPKEKLCFFPNWSEISRFKDVQRSSALLETLGVDPSRKVLLYSGTIGAKQGLENVIEAARRMRARTELVFLIVGDGAGKGRLVDLAKQYDLDNVIFAPLQPYDVLPELLASADCHLVVQKIGVADAVLPSKLTNILAVGGNAVITADSQTNLGMLCSEYAGIAVRVEPESVDALIEGIEHTLAMPEKNVIATGYAQEFLDKDKILTRFLAEVV
ncbi:glycosyltransferase WbuB [Halomonas sp. McH1-25]|uniref:glycosyltransferase WbuB n=1 Tax=unclassified Halomonas TaxID=2609666 RepID=UPI001EF41FA8|nr:MULTISPECIES: glycosyltransferase WbuB [unclassified Halomonas]MCG7601007.1 glycosyltransferase WbuB [Halomonas sp. McH1-25]MCP1342098.1 glycosyltransferase WbuB [Halomonas sp. FL8]MCP1360613.1 glycosyltransferase WbuB [Halomonas sp. BBD45]MCP1364641.1 glycosyltransferase WbuB [Halomonas sp. BBD48]